MSRYETKEEILDWQGEQQERIHLFHKVNANATYIVCGHEHIYDCPTSIDYLCVKI
jgi:hypothetical protein